MRKLQKRINFDIGQVRENTHMLKVNQEDPENKKLLENANKIKKKETLNRNENNKLRNTIKEILTKQEKEFPKEGNQKPQNRTKTNQEEREERELIIKKPKQEKKNTQNQP